MAAVKVLRKRADRSEEEMTFNSAGEVVLAIKNGELAADDRFFSVKRGEWRFMADELLFRMVLLEGVKQTIIPFGPTRRIKRLLNLVCDLVVIWLASGFVLLVGLYLQVESMAFYVLYPVLTYFLYYVLMETLCARTVGKYLTGTVIISSRGVGVDFPTALLRALIRLGFLCFTPYSFFLLGSSDLALHDRWTGTTVVDKSRVTSTGR